MKRSYHVGSKEKHRIDVDIQWFLGVVVLKLDGKKILKKPFLFKIDETFEIGSDERHLIHFRFNLFDYLKNVVHVSIDGQSVTREQEILDSDHVDTPADDAAAALLFVAFVNVVFSVIGTIFVPYLDSLQVRLLLLVGAFIYLFFAMECLLSKKTGLILGILFFVADSIYISFFQFSWGGLMVRTMVLYYLILGLKYLVRIQPKGFLGKAS